MSMYVYPYIKFSFYKLLTYIFIPFVKFVVTSHMSHLIREKGEEVCSEVGRVSVGDNI